MPIADIDYREYLSPEDIQNVTNAFNAIDTAECGSIGEKELAVMFESLGHKLSRKQLLEIINEVDFDGSGGIELEEFYVMNIRFKKLWPRPDCIDYRDYFMDVKVRNVRRAFEACDTEGTGFIDENDFVDSVLETLQLQPREEFLDAVLKQALPPDGTGKMSFDRCCNTVVVLGRTRKRLNYREFLTAKEVEQYRKVFEANDLNKDWSVSVQELDRILQRLGFVLKPKALKSIVKDFDTDESGEIDFEEFAVMMCRMMRKRRQRLISPETCSCRDLYRDDRFSVKELFLAGFQLCDLRRAGVAVRDIRKEGVNALEFRRAGYTTSELRKAGVKLTELRGAGYSLADLRNAGFSDGSVSEANRAIRNSVSVGNLAVLSQTNPASGRTIYGKDVCHQLPVDHPLRMMTPLIRGHTDWNVFPDPPKKHSLAAAGAGVIGTSCIREALLEEDSNCSPTEATRPKAAMV